MTEEEVKNFFFQVFTSYPDPIEKIGLDTALQWAFDEYGQLLMYEMMTKEEVREYVIQKLLWYPDIIEKGGDKKAFQCAFHEISSELTVANTGFDRVEKGSRFSQISMASYERLFIADFWHRGVCLAKGGTSELLTMTQAIDTWVGHEATLNELATFDFIEIYPEAYAYERGEEVEQEWRHYLSWVPENWPELTEFVNEAAIHPELRQLYPFMSVNRFCFSRCTGFPYTHDIPVVGAGKNDGYEVMNSSGEILGYGMAQQAALLVIDHLPVGCGPAAAGTAEGLATS